MPNWCDNKLIIKGSKEALDKFLNTHIIEGCFDFNTVIPQPTKPEDCDPSFVLPLTNDNTEWFDWYSWNIRYWGTKRNADDTLVVRNFDTVVAIFFYTAWSPAIFIIEKLIDIYKDSLIFEYAYFEPGMMFGGLLSLNEEGLYDLYEPESSEELFNFAFEQDFIDEETKNDFLKGGEE